VNALPVLVPTYKQLIWSFEFWNGGFLAVASFYRTVGLGRLGRLSPQVRLNVGSALSFFDAVIRVKVVGSGFLALGSVEGLRHGVTKEKLWPCSYLA